MKSELDINNMPGAKEIENQKSPRQGLENNDSLSTEGILNLIRF